MDKILESLFSPGGLWLMATALVLLLKFLASKWPKLNIDGLIYKAFLYAENTIPDDTKNKALAKADAFAKKFVEEYTKRYGKAPKAKVANLASDLVEKLAISTKVGRNV